jgi:hypothetical protein
MSTKRPATRRERPGKIPQKLSFNVMPLDISEFLEDDETIAEYLSAALEDPNPQVFLDAQWATWLRLAA